MYLLVKINRPFVKCIQKFKRYLSAVSVSEKYVLRGKDPDMPVSQENTGSVLYKALNLQNKNAIAMVNDETGEKITYGQLIQNSVRLAHSFSDYKVVSDKVIAICSDNHVKYFSVVLGALQAGIPIVFINPKYTEYELQNALNLTQPDMIFCSSLYLEKIAKMKQRNNFLRKIVTIDIGETSANSDSFEKFLDQHSDESLGSKGFISKEVDAKNHPAFILFSSGTTGLPKGVMHTHLGVNSSFSSVLDGSVNFFENMKVTLGVLPFFHVFGLHLALIGLYRGTKYVIMEKFTPELYLQYVEKYQVSTLAAVPPLVQFLLKNKIVDKYDLSCVKEILCGAAPLGEKLIKSTKKKFNIHSIRQGYGLTELTSGITVSPLNDSSNRAESVGRIYPGLSLTIKDINTGQNLGPNQEGEICVKGGIVMKGYYKNEEATRDTFTKDGWLKTGDVGYYDKDGYLYIVDRIKELIKYKGFQVAPAELEQILISHPKIEDVGVVGLPDDNVGELPVAFVVKQPNVSLTENEVHQHLANFVSRNKYLQGGVIFTDTIPRNPSGKVLRRELKKMIIDMKTKPQN